MGENPTPTILDLKLYFLAEKMTDLKDIEELI